MLGAFQCWNKPVRPLIPALARSGDLAAGAEGRLVISIFSGRLAAWAGQPLPEGDSPNQGFQECSSVPSRAKAGSKPGATFL